MSGVAGTRRHGKLPVNFSNVRLIILRRISFVTRLVNLVILMIITQCPLIKSGHCYNFDNFGKYGAILIILSLLHSGTKCRTKRNKSDHLTSNVFLHYLVKFKC